MIVSLQPVSAGVPSQNNEIALTTSRDVCKTVLYSKDMLHPIFFYCSSTDLLSYATVNKVWKSVAQKFLVAKYPTYTQEEFLVALRECLTLLKCSQQFVLHVVYLGNQCPYYPKTIAHNGLVPTYGKFTLPLLSMKARLIELDEKTLTTEISYSNVLCGIHPLLYNYSKQTSLPEDFDNRITTVITGRIQEINYERLYRPFKVVAIMIWYSLVASIALYLFMNTKGQPIKDL